MKYQNDTENIAAELISLYNVQFGSIYHADNRLHLLFLSKNLCFTLTILQNSYRTSLMKLGFIKNIKSELPVHGKKEKTGKTRSFSELITWKWEEDGNV